MNSIAAQQESEHVVKNLDAFHAAVELITDLQATSTGVPTLREYVEPTFVWRGVGDSSWGVHSSISRVFDERYLHQGSEAEVAKFEQHIMASATQWNLDWQALGGRLSGLEFLAKLQHHGIPTRLIDVTYQPLVALWFAVQELEHAGCDGRVICWDATELHVPADWGSSRGLPWNVLTERFDLDCE